MKNEGPPSRDAKGGLITGGPEGEDKFPLRTRPIEEAIKKAKLKNKGQEKAQNWGQRSESR